jgi:hypothetical protein
MWQVHWVGADRPALFYLGRDRRKVEDYLCAIADALQDSQGVEAFWENVRTYATVLFWAEVERNVNQGLQREGLVLR